MLKELPLTIVDNENLRGIIAPAKFVSKELLEYIIDLIEWSTPEAILETEQRIKEANRNNSWIPSKEIEKRLEKRIGLLK